MNILLTGATGFLGRNIYAEHSKVHNIDTLGKSKCSININLAVYEPVLLNAYDIIIHSAGKAHSIPKTEEEKLDFFNVNVNGTKNLLNTLEKTSIPKAFIFISTVAVYGIEKGNLIKESAPLFATDAYGKSKIQAEKIIQNWCLNHNVICTILRLPLIVGINPPGNLKVMISAIKKGYYLNVSGGRARKSMVFVKDVAKIIPVVANIGGIYNLTDRYHPTFFELAELIASQLGKPKPLNIPKWLVLIIAKTGDLLGSKALINTKKLSKITSDLTFDDSKAVKLLNWNPTAVLDHFKIC